METIYIRIEKKGRRGKTVTILDGFTRSSSELEDLASQMKKACGTGGTIRDGIIEIQGDCRQNLTDFLKKQGFAIKGI
jgi:translation initiation factor 1